MRIKLLALICLELLIVAHILALPDHAAANEATAEFSLYVEIATVDGSPVVSDEWVNAQREAANPIFEPSGIHFGSTLNHANPEMAADLVTRGDRHALGPLVDPERGVIHVFVVRSMADVDVEGRLLRGVHWRSTRGGGRRHFVVLTTLAQPNVLAHELGHFFGNPHSDTPGNIMSYERGNVPPFFDRGQLRRIRRFWQRFVRSGELRIH